MFSLFFCKADSLTNCMTTFSKELNNKFDSLESLACITELCTLLKHSSINVNKK